MDAVCNHNLEGIFIIRRQTNPSKFLRSFVPFRYDMHNGVKTQHYKRGGSKDRTLETDTHRGHNEKQGGSPVF